MSAVTRNVPTLCLLASRIKIEGEGKSCEGGAWSRGGGGMGWGGGLRVGSGRDGQAAIRECQGSRPDPQLGARPPPSSVFLIVSKTSHVNPPPIAPAEDSRSLSLPYLDGGVKRLECVCVIVGPDPQLPLDPRCTRWRKGHAHTRSSSDTKRYGRRSGRYSGRARSPLVNSRPASGSARKKSPATSST